MEDFRQKLENEVRKIGLNCNVNLTTENNNYTVKVDSEIDRMLIHDLHIWQLDSQTRAGTRKFLKIIFLKFINLNLDFKGDFTLKVRD